MSKVAEQKALEAYPIKEEWVGNQYGGLEDINSLSREKYQEGYNQAMQDFMEKAYDYLKRNYPSIFDTYQESGYNEIERFKEYLEL